MSTQEYSVRKTSRRRRDDDDDDDNDDEQTKNNKSACRTATNPATKQVDYSTVTSTPW